MKQWFLRPSLELEVIKSRHDAVECFLRGENRQSFPFIDLLAVTDAGRRARYGDYSEQFRIDQERGENGQDSAERERWNEGLANDLEVSLRRYRHSRCDPQPHESTRSGDCRQGSSNLRIVCQFMDRFCESCSPLSMLLDFRISET